MRAVVLVLALTGATAFTGVQTNGRRGATRVTMLQEPAAAASSWQAREAARVKGTAAAKGAAAKGAAAKVSAAKPAAAAAAKAGAAKAISPAAIAGAGAAVTELTNSIPADLGLGGASASLVKATGSLASKVAEGADYGVGGLADVTDKLGAGAGAAAGAASAVDFSAWSADSLAYPGVPEWVLPAAGFAAGVATMAVAKPAADEAAMVDVMESNENMKKDIEEMKDNMFQNEASFEAKTTSLAVEYDTKLRVELDTQKADLTREKDAAVKALQEATDAQIAGIQETLEADFTEKNAQLRAEVDRLMKSQKVANERAQSSPRAAFSGIQRPPRAPRTPRAAPTPAPATPARTKRTTPARTTPARTSGGDAAPSSRRSKVNFKTGNIFEALSKKIEAKSAKFDATMERSGKAFDRVGERFDKDIEEYTAAVEKNSEAGAKRYEERSKALNDLTGKISVPKIDASKVKEGVDAVAKARTDGETTFEMAAPSKKTDFLEASPWFSQDDVPINTYKNKSPFTGKITSVKRIVGPQATGETCDIVIDHGGKMPYWEGQSFGVIPPGTNPKNGKPNSVRLYSIAASRYGDDFSGMTTTLCVRRATYWCPELGAEDPAKKGVCSNFLCDATPGTDCKMTGPSGKVMLMPESDNYDADIIMVATGTGIAPYRAFWKRLFVENGPAAEAYKGVAWLFLGVANSDALLYDDELQAIKTKFPDNFKLDYALSREATNKKGGKMYIQDKVEEYADEIFDRLSSGAHIYFCGLKGMMPGIQDMLKDVCEKKGLDYDEYIKGLKKAGQWHVEVY